MRRLYPGLLLVSVALLAVSLVAPPAEAELAAAKDRDARQRAQWAATEVLELWTTAPAERPKHLSRRFGDMFRPNGRISR